MDNNFYRIIDANLNRGSEGLRVCEDYARFIINNEDLTEQIKKIRHELRKNVDIPNSELILYRDSEKDFGPCISDRTGIDIKKNVEQIITANMKRVQESLRTIEEWLKPINPEASSKYEKLRFSCYSIEKELYKQLKKQDKKKLLDTDIYCITDSPHSLGRSNIEVVKSMLESGIKIIQYREKDKSMKEKYEECKIIRLLTREFGAAFIINDHPELALIIGADGIHIGQDDIPLTEVRKIVGFDMIIGVSTHSPEQAQKAIEDGADYIGVGPIFKTFTKRDVCEPVGLTYLEYAVNNVNIPFVAIGGIKEANIHEIVKKGAKLICLVTEITSADDIKAKIESIRKQIKESKGSV